MCIAVIGGMDRLQRHYIEEAGRVGISLKVFNRLETNMASKLKGVDAFVIFTNKVSHRIKREAVNIAKTRKIPLLMYHSCGVSTLRDCFQSLKDTTKKA